MRKQFEKGLKLLGFLRMLYEGLKAHYWLKGAAIGIIFHNWQTLSTVHYQGRVSSSRDT